MNTLITNMINNYNYSHLKISKVWVSLHVLSTTLQPLPDCSCIPARWETTNTVTRYTLSQPHQLPDLWRGPEDYLQTCCLHHSWVLWGAFSYQWTVCCWGEQSAKRSAKSVHQYSSSNWKKLFLLSTDVSNQHKRKRRDSITLLLLN